MNPIWPVAPLHVSDAGAHRRRAFQYLSSNLFRRFERYAVCSRQFPNCGHIGALSLAQPAGPYGARTFATASQVVTNSDQISLRLDHHVANGHLFARVTMDNFIGPVTNPDQTAIDPAFGLQYIDRQRNIALKYTRALSPRLVEQTLLSFIRSTPGIPTADHTDPGVIFNNSLFESFNSAADSVMQSYGNLFQLWQSFGYTTDSHVIKAGLETRLNRDTTYFGISPNDVYNFGGGTAYATEAIPSASGKHNVAAGDPLPDTLSAFLSGSTFSYSIAVAPPYFSGGQHIGPAAISRNNVSLWAQDNWQVTPRFTLDTACAGTCTPLFPSVLIVQVALKS